MLVIHDGRHLPSDISHQSSALMIEIDAHMAFGTGTHETTRMICRQLLNMPLEGKRVLITAGPTYEKIDPVRFIGNYSSGKMGFSLAAECQRRGADVQLIAGPVSLPTPAGVARTDVESCSEMHEAALRLFGQADAAILCAAVADYRPSEQSDTKIKRKGAITLELTPNPDIAHDLGQQKRSDQVMVGFAVETNAEEQHALEKLEKKNLDLIVLNSLRNEGTCFRSDDNQIVIYSREGKQAYGKKPKSEVAADIVDAMVRELQKK